MDGLRALSLRLQEFSAARDWGQFHNAKNLVMLIASEAGELVAEYRWVTTDAADAYTRTPANRARVENEIGDVGIALLLLCERTGIDLERAIGSKIERNAHNYPVEDARGQPERP